MRALSKPVLWLAAALGWCVLPLYAQPITESSCSQVCNATYSPCSDYCEDNGTWITCGQYGVCNADPDNDGWTSNDNCPYTYNPSQANCDGDSAGDACDGESSNYQMVSSYLPCYIVPRAHLGYMDQRLYEEALFRDVSACGKPDQWRQRNRVGYCVGYFPPSYAQSCCWSLWGVPACDAFLSNNQCH